MQIMNMHQFTAVIIYFLAEIIKVNFNYVMHLIAWPKKKIHAQIWKKL